MASKNVNKNTAQAFANQKVKTSDDSLSDFLAQLENYTPTIPDAVSEHYLHTAGLNTADARIVQLISLSAQKFISEIATDALQHSKIRGANQNTISNDKDCSCRLTMDDLALAAAEYGITIRKPHYFP